MLHINKFSISLVLIIIILTSTFVHIKNLPPDDKSNLALTNKEKKELTKYVNSFFGLDDDKNVVIFAINENVCSSNILVLEKLTSEINPMFFRVIINSPNTRFYKPLAHALDKCNELKIPIIIDNQDKLALIYPYNGYPLIIYISDKKVTKSSFLRPRHYEDTVKQILDFVLDK